MMTTIRGMALFVALCCVYLLTYSANLISNDELMMLDVTGSLVQFGDFKYDLALWYQPTTTFDPATPYPLRTSDIDPLQMIVATPLFALAYLLPGVGLVHMTWLLNVLLCAGAGVLLYSYARRRGYGGAALAGALLLGLGTVVWPYSKVFFREPLALLLLLATVMLLDEWRRRWREGQAAIGYLLAALATTGLLLLAKAALVTVLPGLLLLALPEIDRRWWRGLLLGGVVALVGLAALLAFTPMIENLVPSGQYTLAGYTVNTAFTQTALHSYLFSLGGSLWGSSPVLLLALPGAWLLWRRGERQTVLAALLMLFGVALAYALLRDWAWFAGLSWPPRFLVPLIGVLMLLVLPVLERFPRLPRWMQAGIVLLVLYSLWWQLAGVALPWPDYAAALPPESNGLADWLPGLNTVAYLRPVVVMRLLLDGVALDFAWVRGGVWLWPVLFALVGGLALWLLWKPRRVAYALPVLLVLTLAVGLPSLYRDPRYTGTKDSLHQMVDLIRTTATSGDVVVLSDTTYHEFFLNYGKADVRFVALPIHPGERGSFEQELQVVSDVPAELLAPSSPAQLQALAAAQPHLWVLMETSAFLPWAIRPVERFMTLHYYPLREINTTPPDATVRLLEYATTPAPESPVVEAEMQFGGSLVLTGYTLPEGVTYTPGEALPISLYWQAEAVPEVDATVAFFLVNEGRVVQGQDSPPGGGFAPTSTWETDTTHLDNRALRLPDDLPPGEYELWLRLYTFGADGTLQTLPVRGSTVREEDIAVLPTTITVTR